jgi:hypothetical protein
LNLATVLLQNVASIFHQDKASRRRNWRHKAGEGIYYPRAAIIFPIPILGVSNNAVSASGRCLRLIGNACIANV